MQLNQIRATQFNYVQQWMMILGARDRAERLASVAPTQECPTVWLFGQDGSDALYAAGFHAALDAWDTGKVSQREIKAWARWVLEGRYQGPVLHKLNGRFVLVEQAKVTKVPERERHETE